MAEFTGERVIPGKVDRNLLNEHLARYVFAARLAKSKRVLDAGCGAGYGSAELAKTALSVLGADQSEEAIRYAREHYRLPNLRFEQGSCLKLPHPDASFDLVVAFEVIEHLSGWREFLLEVRRVLGPAGQFIVSTPNKIYYNESRGQAGPNPFHVHEFEYAEFRGELSAIFPHIELFVENHVEGMVFQPVQPDGAAEVRVDGAEVVPAQAHFFVAVCAHRPQIAIPTFVYVPSAANVLLERDRHIALLETELRIKDSWAEDLKREFAQAIARMQDELAAQQADFSQVVEGYEQKIAELERESQEQSDWAIETRKELDDKINELAECVEYLHAAERTIEERTAWAVRLQGDSYQLEKQLSLLKASRWVRLGRALGMARTELSS